MRIALVHSFYSSRQPSGENITVESEAAALRRAGYEVKLFAAHTDHLEGSRLYTVRSALRVASGRGRSPAKALAAFDPDVVHVHNLFPNFSRKWVEDVEVPVIATLHNYRPLCANGFMFRDGGACSLCPDGSRWAGVRYGCYRSRMATIPLAWSNRHGPMGDPLLKRANLLVVLSQRQREVYLQAGVPADKLTVVPNFLPDEFDPGRVVSPGGTDWLFVGRLSEEKGILRLVERWPSNQCLKVVGDGPLRQATETAASGRPVELVGEVSRARVVELMRQAQGLVFPSLWHETFGLVYIEALAAGLPVLAFDSNTVADSVTKEGTGLVCGWDTQLELVVDQAKYLFPQLRPHCRDIFEGRYTERVRRRVINQMYGS